MISGIARKPRVAPAFVSKKDFVQATTNAFGELTLHAIFKMLTLCSFKQSFRLAPNFLRLVF